MKVFKSIAHKLLMFLLSMSLFATICFFASSYILGSPNTVKSWLDDSGFYEVVIDNAFNLLNSSENDERTLSDVIEDNPNLDITGLEIAFKTVITPEYMQEQTEVFIDAWFSFLEGETDKPIYVIDMTQKNQELATALSDELIKQYSFLPKCDEPPISTYGLNAFSLTCKFEGMEEVIKTNANQNIAGDGSVSSNQITYADNYTAQELQDIQSAWSIAGTAPWVAVIISMLLSVGVFFLAKTKRSGLKSVGGTMLFVGLPLLIMFVAFNYFVDITATFTDYSYKNSENPETYKTIAQPLIETALSDIFMNLIIYSGIISFIGFIVFMIGIKMPKNNNKPSDTILSEDNPETTENYLNALQQEGIALSNQEGGQVYPKNQPAVKKEGATAPASPSPVRKPAKPAVKKQTPKRPKPPTVSG